MHEHHFKEAHVLLCECLTHYCVGLQYAIIWSFMAGVSSEIQVFY